MDCDFLSTVMEEKEKTLLRLGWGLEPEVGLRRALKMSPLCWSAFVDDEIVAMFGCVDGSEPGVGNPWMVTGRGIKDVKLRFVRQSLRYLPIIFERYEVLVCYAYEENESLVGWIRWLGFDVTTLSGGFVRGVLEKCAYRRR
jgi:hypothetical protein